MTEWKYGEADYETLWADAAKYEVMLSRIGRKTERGPRAVWAHLHGMTLQELNDQKLRLPAWASRALRHPTYKQMVENMTRIAVLESDLAAAVTLKNIVKEGEQRAAIELLKQLTLLGVAIPPKDLLAIFKTLHGINEKLTIPESAIGEDGEVKTPEQILQEEQKELEDYLSRLPPEWRDSYINNYKKMRGQELIDEKIRLKREASTS